MPCVANAALLASNPRRKNGTSQRASLCEASSKLKRPCRIGFSSSRCCTRVVMPRRIVRTLRRNSSPVSLRAAICPTAFGQVIARYPAATVRRTDRKSGATLATNGSQSDRRCA